MSIKKIPMRQCIGCGEMKSKKEMIRVIKTAENAGCHRAEERERRLSLSIYGVHAEGHQNKGIRALL